MIITDEDEKFLDIIVQNIDSMKEQLKIIKRISFKWKVIRTIYCIPIAPVILVALIYTEIIRLYVILGIGFTKIGEWTFLGISKVIDILSYAIDPIFNLEKDTILLKKYNEQIDSILDKTVILCKDHKQ